MLGVTVTVRVRDTVRGQCDAYGQVRDVGVRRVRVEGERWR